MATEQPLPPTRELKTFGLLFATVLAVLFGIIIPLFRHGMAGLPFADANPLWPWVSAAVIALWAFVHAASLKWLYRPWMKFAAVAQWVNTHIIMFLLFYVMILPIGLILRLFGKDPLHKRFEKQQQSYRRASEKRAPDHLDKPF